MLTITGESIMKGVASGTLRFYRKMEREVPGEDTQDIKTELEKFESARQRLKNAQQSLYEKTKAEAGEESAEIFLAHMQMLDDEMLKNSVKEIIREQNRSAAYAVQVGLSSIVGRFQAMDDLYVSARSEDIADLANGLLDELTGMASSGIEGQKPYILAAEQLSPSELMKLDRKRLAGIVLCSGSKISHTSIIAKGMEIPMLIKCSGLDESLEGKEAVLDGYTGHLFLEPTPEQKILTEERRSRELDDKDRIQKLKDKETVTADGRKIRLLANIGDPSDVGAVIANGAEGVGLFRTEFLFLNNSDFPTEEEQFFVYRQVLKTLAPKPVIIRTCDIGADKASDYMNFEAEDNPALGLRGVRFSLARRGIFKTQLRAMLRASSYGTLGIMIPMISDVQEIRECRELLSECREELEAQGTEVGSYEFGITVETPAAVLCAEELAGEVDFFSVGSNDLAQYTLAVDRQNTRLASFFDPCHPSVLRLIRMAAEAGHKKGIRVGICGEIGSDPALTETFLQAGIDELSVNPKSILPIRERVMTISGARAHSDDRLSGSAAQHPG